MKKLIILVLSFFVFVSCTAQETEAAILKRIDKKIIKTASNRYEIMDIDGFENELISLFEMVTKGTPNAEYRIIKDEAHSIPYMIVFKPKVENDKNDSGELVLYSFQSGFKKTDSYKMDFEKRFNKIHVGKISKDTSGIVLSIYIGTNSESVYMFRVSDNRIVNCLTNQRQNFISVIEEVEIGDRNSNGILDFCLVSEDPEISSKDNLHKIKVYYEWDGENSGKVVTVDRSLESSYKTPAFKDLFNMYKNDTLKLKNIKDRLDELSSKETSILLNGYIENINNKRDVRKDTFIKNSSAVGVENIVEFLDNYRIDIESLNDADFIRESEAFSHKVPFKVLLTNILEEGYLIFKSKDTIDLQVNFGYLKKQFNTNLLNEYSDFLDILGKEQFYNEKMKLGTQSYEDQTNLILLTEDFLIKYPYSESATLVEYLNKKVLTDLIFCDFSKDDSTYNKRALSELNEIAGKHPFSFAKSVIFKLNELLKDNILSEEDIETLKVAIETGVLQ